MPQPNSILDPWPGNAVAGLVFYPEHNKFLLITIKGFFLCLFFLLLIIPVFNEIAFLISFKDSFYLYSLWNDYNNISNEHHPYRYKIKEIEKNSLRWELRINYQLSYITDSCTNCINHSVHYIPISIIYNWDLYLLTAFIQFAIFPHTLLLVNTNLIWYLFLFVCFWSIIHLEHYVSSCYMS